jgi:hypothetical protein
VFLASDVGIDASLQTPPDRFQLAAQQLTTRVVVESPQQRCIGLQETLDRIEIPSAGCLNKLHVRGASL